jgi:acyl-CoA-binding protein
MEGYLFGLSLVKEDIFGGGQSWLGVNGCVCVTLPVLIFLPRREWIEWTRKSCEKIVEATLRDCPLFTTSDFVTNMETKKQAMVALKREFKQAIKFVLATEGDDPRVTQLVKLRFYAYFKQGTEGKCTGTRPSIFSPLKRLMWESWNRLGKMKKKKAMQLYIKQLDKLETNWRDPNWKRSKL